MNNVNSKNNFYDIKHFVRGRIILSLMLIVGLFPHCVLDHKWGLFVLARLGILSRCYRDTIFWRHSNN